MSRRESIARLRKAAPAILPSLLLCDFGHLEREIEQLEQTGVPGLHLDVMDGVFVPNFTYGMTIVEAVRRLTQLPIDVHLMMVNPGQYVERFCEAGADLVTFHIEAEPNAGPVLEKIRRQGAAAGIALNPATPLEQITGCLEAADMALVMSVPAGFGGQPFHPVALEKLSRLREIAGPELLLEVDGGVNQETIGRCAQAGAELFVVGSAIFRAPEYGRAVRDLAEAAAAPI